MIRSTSFLLMASLMLGACASNYNNGVSTWNAKQSQPELLETQQFEKYVVEEDTAPQYRVVEEEVSQLAEEDLIAVSESTPTIILSKPTRTNYVVDSTYDYPSPAPVSIVDEISTVSSSSRSNYNYLNVRDMDQDSSIPDSVMVSPYENVKKVTYKQPTYKKTTKTYAVVETPMNLGSGTYSNKSRGPYEYNYGNPVKTHNQVITTTSSSTRTYSVPSSTYKRNLNTGCFANLDYPASMDDQVSRKTSVLCKSQLNSNLVSKIQSSLNGAGFNAGPVTGYLSTKTLDALYKYQTAKNLAAGAVTLDTLNSLGINSYNF